MYGIGIAQSRPRRLGAFDPLPAELDPALAANLTALALDSYDDSLRKLASEIKWVGRDIHFHILSAINDSTKTIAERGWTDFLVDLAKAPFTQNNDYTNLLKKLGAIRLMGYEWINEVKRSWINNQLNLAYEKIDQQDAERVSKLFAQMVEATGSVTKIIRETSEIPEAVILQGVRDFYRTYWELIVKALAKIAEIAILVFELGKSVLKAAKDIVDKIPKALDWLPIVLVSVGAVGVIYLLS